MIVYLLFKVDWCTSGTENRNLVDVYLDKAKAETDREELQDMYGFASDRFGTDYEVVEKESK